MTDAETSDDVPPEDSGDSDGQPPEKSSAAVYFILITLFIDILGIGIIIPVLPGLVKTLVEQDGTLSADLARERATQLFGIIGTSYALMQFLFAPVLGALSDRFGRRPIILGSLFGFGVDFLIQGFATSIGWLFAGRLIAGVMGASFSTANAYIADISNDENRARNFGFMGVAFGLGFAFGPALGGLLGGYHERLPFFVCAGLALVNWLYGFFILPESLPKERRSKFSLRKANPFSALMRLRAYPIVAGLAIVFVLTSLAQRGLQNVWVLFTTHRYNWDATDNGWALALVGVTALFVQGGMIRPCVKRFGERKTALMGAAAAAIAFLGYAVAWEGWMIPWIIVFGALGGLSGPAIQSIVAKNVDPAEQGKVQGSLTSLMSLTSVFAPTIFTTLLLTYFTSDRAPIQLPGAPFYFGFGLLTLGFIVMLIVFKRIPEQTQEAS